MSRVMMIFGIAPVIAPMVGAQLLWLGGWHGIFWLLLAFTVLMAMALQLLLRETHPPESRTPFVPRQLLAGYAGVRARPAVRAVADCQFGEFCRAVPVHLVGAAHRARTAASVGAGVSLAVPAGGGRAGVRRLAVGAAGRAPQRGVYREPGLRLDGRGVPAACARGAGVSGSRGCPGRCCRWCCRASACSWRFRPSPCCCWIAFRMRRGGASSVQAFVSLLLNAGVAGVLSPLLSGSMLTLALGSSALTLVGWVRMALVSAHHARAAAGAAAARRGVAGADRRAALSDAATRRASACDARSGERLA